MTDVHLVDAHIAGVQLSAVHLPAVFAAALASFVIGGLWYSPLLFSKPWQHDNALSDEALSKGAARVFAGAFALALLQSLALALLLGEAASPLRGLALGVAAGVGLVASGLTTTFLFERRPARLIAIDASYHILSFTAMGVLLGTWH